MKAYSLVALRICLMNGHGFMSQTRLEPEARVPILRGASVRECVAYLLQSFIAVLKAEEDSDKHGLSVAMLMVAVAAIVPYPSIHGVLPTTCRKAAGIMARY